MTSLVFSQAVKHGRIELMPGVPLAFEDPLANDYFTRLGWASASDDVPVRTYSAEEVVIDPETRRADTGAIVLDVQDGVISNG